MLHATEHPNGLRCPVHAHPARTCPGCAELELLIRDFYAGLHVADEEGHGRTLALLQKLSEQRPGGPAGPHANAV